MSLDILPTDLNFQPKPEEWYDAVLDFVNWSGHALSAKLTNGERAFFHPMDISITDHGHYYCVPIGVPLAVRIVRQDIKQRAYPYRCLEVVFVIDDYDPWQFQRGRITKWRGDGDGNYGVITRPCGCSLLALGNSEYPEQLHVGDEVEFDTVFSTHKNKWIAKNMVVIGSAAKE
jgi:hypothetical protein